MTQWHKPYRLLYKNYGITVWKWCGIYLPLFDINLGGKEGGINRHIGFDIFHNGCGIVIYFPGIICLKLCTRGKIGWWYKYGKCYLSLFNKWRFEF